ncbi:uncharacterized protein BT62DRAFT_940691, partial [Guyanagaster necrorhizus]
MDELLKSNNPPLPAERIQLKGVIGEGHGFLAGLRERRTQTGAALEALLDEERRVERLIESCKTILCPIRTISDNIVHKIFFIYHFEAVVVREEESLNGQFVPLVLSQVCRDWRATALSTSQLWSFIRLDFDVYRNEEA